MDILKPASSIHCHKNQDPEADVDVSARRRLICASILCLSFMLIELIGGILANSLAIATDAAHLLTDFASFMISLFSLWMGARPATKRFSFGWYRAEVIGALTSVIMIWAVTGVLVYMAIQRMISKEYNIDATIMLISASVGVVVNIIMGLALQIHPTGGFGHHSHGSEESGRRFDLPSTEPFVPQPGGVTTSEIDSSRICRDVFRVVPSRSTLYTGSLQATMSTPHGSVGETTPCGPHSASAPSMPSSLYAEAARQPAGGANDPLPRGASLPERSGEPPAATPAKTSASSEDVAGVAGSGVQSRSASPQTAPDDVGPSGSGSTGVGGKHKSSTIMDDGPHKPQQAGGQEGGLPVSSTASARTIGQSSSDHKSFEPQLSEASPARSARGVMNLNVRAAFVHVLGDLIQSVGVLLAAIVIFFCPGCGVVDPVCTLMFSVIVLVTTVTILREALNVLMEGIPHSVDYHQVKRLLLSVDGVARVHDLHIWALSLDKIAVSAHVVLVPGADAMAVRRNASKTIRRSVEVFKLTLQMEEFDEGIRQHCRRCSEPS